MRGADGFERSIMVRQFWEKVHKADLLHRIESTFRSLAASVFRIRPTLYSRFTFTVNRVMTTLVAGSPKILTNQKRSVQAWFFASGLSYSVPGAVEHADMAIDAITHTIQEARKSEPGEGSEAQFFLEFVTCRAYTVKEG
jgi:hypothetical protein